MALMDYPTCEPLCVALCRLMKKQEVKMSDQQLAHQAAQERSYYGFSGPSSSPAHYYPAFDPISVLASLAFLAFLLQTFAALFDRSRSSLPSIISARKASNDLDAISRVERQVLDALDNYVNAADHNEERDNEI